jgi:hypothetical protein
MIGSLALPAALLMIAAVLVARGFETLLPESIAGMVVCALLSSLTLWLLSGAGFAALYLWQDARVAALMGDGRGVAHFAGLGAKAAIIWAPLMALTVITAPRRWTTAEW